MLLFKKVKDLQRYIQSHQAKGISIGFVPTMGALHKGHLSLIDKCRQTVDISVASIFVNPTQFNEAKDLAKYPRTPNNDIDLLASVNCDVLFMPSVEEVYPDGPGQFVGFDFGYLSVPMEGAHRPGHFQGMAQVVNRLLEIVCPNSLFMGQKDYQQFAIVKNMLQQQKSNISLVMCPIVREEDGLAMSSRNIRLNKEQRLIAPNIYRTLAVAKEKMHAHYPPHLIEKEAMKMLDVPDMEPEYFEIVDGDTLRPFERFDDVESAVACTAIKLGDIRLIDNLILKNRA